MPELVNSSCRSSRAAMRLTSACWSRVTQRHADAAAPGPAGAADTVHVALVVLGRVEVDHVRDRIEVEPARGHVGRNQRARLARLEPLPGPLAGALGHVAVHRHGRHAALAQLGQQAIGAAPGAHEHQRVVVALVQHVDQGLHLGLGRHLHEPVIDLLHRLIAGIGLVVRGVGRVAAGEPAHLAVERGREEHRLAILRQPSHDPVDLRLEAHVEHPVGLVQHQDRHGAQREHLAVGEILEATRSRHQQVRAVGLLGLVVEADSAVGGGHPQAACSSQRLQHLAHLGGQLAGRDQHQRGRGGAVRVDSLDQRDAEGERLAGAGGRLGQHVLAGESVGKHPALNLEWGLDALGSEHVGNGRTRTEATEGGFTHLSLLGGRPRPPLDQRARVRPSGREWNLTGRHAAARTHRVAAGGVFNSPGRPYARRMQQTASSKEVGSETPARDVRAELMLGSLCSQ